MSACPGEGELLLLAQGEGLAPHSAHVSACPRCSERYEALLHDLQAMTWLLREGPLRAAAPGRSAVRLAGWAAIAAVGVLLALVVGSLWTGPPAERLATGATAPVSLEDVSSVLFAASDETASEAADSALTDVQVALNGGEYCDGHEAYFDPDCR
jgi:hypothetical protein